MGGTSGPDLSQGAVPSWPPLKTATAIFNAKVN